MAGCLGVTKIPLTYVIRDTIEAPAFDPAMTYPTKQAESIARAPILQPNGAFDQTYLTDRA
jgi:hypothetical protein